MFQKLNFQKTAIRRSKPRKRVNFLTVSANCNFVSSHSRARRPPTLKSIGIEGDSPDLTGICEALCRAWVRPGVGLWLLMGVRLLRLGRGVAVCVACLLMAWWCCSAPDVLAKGCRHGLREREGMKEWNGKEIKKGSGVSLPEP